MERSGDWTGNLTLCINNAEPTIRTVLITFQHSSSLISHSSPIVLQSFPLCGQTKNRAAGCLVKTH